MDGEGLGFPQGGSSTGRHRANEGHGLPHDVEEDVWAAPFEAEFPVGGWVTLEFGEHKIPGDEIQGLSPIPLEGQGAVPSGDLTTSSISCFILANSSEGSLSEGPSASRPSKQSSGLSLISYPKRNWLGVTPRDEWMLALYNMTAVRIPEIKRVSPSCRRLLTAYRVW